MGRFNLLCRLTLFVMFCFIEGETFSISTKFMIGKLIFTWSNISNTFNDVQIIKDSKSNDWTRVSDDRYKVEDVLKYKSVTITVREYNSMPNESYVDYKKTYNVTTIVSQEGESRNISWTTEYFLNSKVYNIYHVNSDQTKKIITVTETSAVHNKKYVYHTRPFDSVNILFEVRNITVEDAGYYVGGGSEADAWSQGKGVVLVVSGKPEKPKIRGVLDVKVGYHTYLKCESRSTSTPDYYKKFSPLLYSWFVNNTRVEREEREKYRIIASKEVKYNRYSCQAKETLESGRSDEIKINPLYGPESIIITPKPLNDTITLKDGDPFGPYNCSADCNPPCTLQWKYKHPSGDFANVTSYGISPLSLPKQIAERTRMTLIRCVASNSEGHEADGIKLKILYLLDPQVYINEILQNSSTINEGKPLSLICHVGGNPTPEVTLRKHSGNQILWQKQLNYTWKTAAQCSDTSTYSCDGKSTEFGSRNQSFYINVSCEPRLDNSNLFKSIYGSMSGPDVNVHVSLPVIANPLTSSSGFTWSGPTSHSISTKISQRDNVIYKHWINSTIPVPDRRSFGNYSLKYKGEVIADITIKAEACPDGTYGPLCKSVCSEGCLSVCDKKNGTCEKCKKGYTGAFCIDVHAFQRRMTSIIEVAGITTSVACFSILFALVLKRERVAPM